MPSNRAAVLTRQYYLFYKRLGSPQFAKLEPGTNCSLYNKPELAEAIEYVRTHPTVEGIAVRVADELFNVIVFEQEAIAAKAFLFNAPLSEAPESPVAEGESVPKTNA